MKLSNKRLRINRILGGNGKEWSKESAAIMDIFLQWLSASSLEKTKCLNRVNGETFEILFHNDSGNDNIQIILSDESGNIGIPFLWDKENGIQKEHYLADTGLLLLHISSMCHNKNSIKKINNFIRKNIL